MFDRQAKGFVAKHQRHLLASGGAPPRWARLRGVSSGVAISRRRLVSAAAALTSARASSGWRTAWPAPAHPPRRGQRHRLCAGEVPWGHQRQPGQPGDFMARAAEPILPGCDGRASTTRIFCSAEAARVSSLEKSPIKMQSITKPEKCFGFFIINRLPARAGLKWVGHHWPASARALSKGHPCIRCSPSRSKPPVAPPASSSARPTIFDILVPSKNARTIFVSEVSRASKQTIIDTLREASGSRRFWRDPAPPGWGKSQYEWMIDPLGWHHQLSARLSAVLRRHSLTVRGALTLGIIRSLPQ